MFVVIYMSGTGEYMTCERETREQAESVKNYDGTPATSIHTEEEFDNSPHLWC